MQNVIENFLAEALQKQNIEDFTINIVNISHKHAGHFHGNGESHFEIIVKSNNLFAKKPLERHKILNNAVADLLRTEKVHAIAFKVEEL